MEFHLPVTSFVLCFSVGKLLGQVLIALRILQSLVKGSELLRCPFFTIWCGTFQHGKRKIWNKFPLVDKKTIPIRRKCFSEAPWKWKYLNVGFLAAHKHALDVLPSCWVWSCETYSKWYTMRTWGKLRRRKWHDEEMKFHKKCIWTSYSRYNQNFFLTVHSRNFANGWPSYC